MSWKEATDLARACRRRGWKATATWRKGKPVVLAAKHVRSKGRVA